MMGKNEMEECKYISDEKNYVISISENGKIEIEHELRHLTDSSKDMSVTFEILPEQSRELYEALKAVHEE